MFLVWFLNARTDISIVIFLAGNLIPSFAECYTFSKIRTPIQLGTMCTITIVWCILACINVNCKYVI